MSNQTTSGFERLQFDKEGQLVARFIKASDDKWAFLLEDGFMLIKHEITGRLGVWDKKQHKPVEFA